MPREDRVDRTKRALGEVHDEFAERTIAQQAVDFEDEIQLKRDGEEAQKRYAREDIEETRKQGYRDQDIQDTRIQEQSEEEFALSVQQAEDEASAQGEEANSQQEGAEGDNKQVGAQSGAEQKIPFPIVSFILAIFKDTFDLIIELFTLGVGAIFVELYNIIYDTVLLGRAYYKFQNIKASKERKERFKNKLIIRMVTMVSISLVPFVNAIIPEATLFVWRNHKAEVELARKGKK